MTSFLEREQHEISTAADGKQGIRLLEKQQFDLAITDVIDGLDVLMWLRLNKQSCHPKAIAISGGAGSLDLNELLVMCRLLSADKVLPKPVDFETLSSAVGEVLESGVEGYQKQA